MTYPPVVVVDENDYEIGEAMLADVWRKGLYHRIVSIFVEDNQGRMLLQYRSPSVKIYPNCWDQAAGGHVDSGHTYNTAAAAEVSEELGLNDVELTTIGTYRYNTASDERIINQFVRVYLVRVPQEIKLRPEAAEIAELRWFSRNELKANIETHPEDFTPGFLHELRQYFSSWLA